MIAIDQNRFKAAYIGRRQNTHGVTLVAFLGRTKPQPFVQVVSVAQRTVKSELAKHRLDAYFEAYPTSHIHATVVGLEGVRRGTDGIINVNLSARLAGIVGKAAVPPMDADGLLEFFHRGYSSVSIQIGGFSKADWNPFDAPNLPYDRTFDIQSNGLFVMMGWPASPSASGPSFLPLLCGIRKHLERFKVVHKYHIAPDDEDNDIFFTIGKRTVPSCWGVPRNTSPHLAGLSPSARRR